MANKTSKTTALMESDVYDALHIFASRRVGATHAADLVHDAYLRFLQLDDKESIREPRAFLFRIIANLGIDFWRKERTVSQWRHEQDDLDLDSIECNMPGIEASVHDAMQVELLLSTLADVPEQARHAFVLNKFEGMSQAAIAERFGVQEKVIQRQIAAVIAHCAKQLGYDD